MIVASMSPKTTRMDCACRRRTLRRPMRNMMPVREIGCEDAERRRARTRRASTTMIGGHRDAEERVHRRRSSPMISAVPHADDAVAARANRAVVRDDDERLSLLAVEALHQRHDLVGGLRIEVAGRLVGPDDGGIVHEGAGDRDALALTAAQLRRPVLGPLAQTRPARGPRAPSRAPPAPACRRRSAAARHSRPRRGPAAGCRSGRRSPCAARGSGSSPCRRGWRCSCLRSAPRPRRSCRGR